jgi:hypothetical protein
MAFWEGVKVDNENQDMKKLLKLAVAKGREDLGLAEKEGLAIKS